MFTGIVQGMGEVLSIARAGEERRFSFRPLFELENIVDGESIAANGACLSVESHDGAIFSAYASRETISRTNLGRLAAGAKVNLERALAIGDRLGGHLVSGHVDCLATVRHLRSDGRSLRCRVAFPPEYGDQVIPKGSVTLDGVSLTVNECGRDFLEVNIIPDSQKRTNIGQWRVGSALNMETDLIGKYVASLLEPWKRARRTEKVSALDRDALARNGFITG